MSKWEMVRLGDVCDVLNGYAFKSDNYVNAGLRVIRITNVQKGFIEDKNPQFYSLEKSDELEKYRLYDDDLLISLTGNVGRVALLPQEYLPAVLNQRVGCIRTKSNMIHQNYLFSCLNSNTFEMDCISNAKGVAQKNMSTEWLKEYKIPLPPLDQQIKIASELDNITKLIENRKLQLEKTDLLVKAKFVEMFGDPILNEMGWEVKRLAELYDTSSSKRIYQAELQTCGVPFYKVSNLVERIYNQTTECSCFISKARYDELCNKGLTPKENDILVTSRGTLGMCYLVQPEDVFYFQDGMISWMVNKQDEITNRYTIELFKTHYMKKQIAKVSKGATVDFLSLDKLRNLMLPIPPLPLQQKFADYVASVEKTKAVMERGLEQLETLYKARMQEYFE